MVTWGGGNDRPAPDDPRVAIEWKNATICIHQWFRFLYYWSVVAYRPDDPHPLHEQGITYTYWGASRRIRAILLRSRA